MLGDGLSVASASEPRLSMMRFTYSSWIDVKADSSSTAAPRNAMIRATTLTVS